MTSGAAPASISLLPVGARRARRHPFAILGIYAWHAVLGLLVALPAASLAGAAYGNDPRGEGPLWASGARELLDFVSHERHGLAAVATGAEGLLLLAAVAGLVPTAVALTAIAYGCDRAGLGQRLAVVMRSVPAMVVVLVGSVVVTGLLALFGSLEFDVVESWFHAPWGEAHAQQAAAVALLPVGLAASLVGVVQDLSRSAIVGLRIGPWQGVLFGLSVFRRAPVSLWWSWAWRWGASLVPVAAASCITSVGRFGPAAVLVLLHQGVVLALIAIRASWWARALRAVDALEAIHPAVTPG